MHCAWPTLHIRLYLSVRLRQVTLRQSASRRAELGRLCFHHNYDKIPYDPEMSDPRKGKSIWKRFDKPRGEAKVENEGKLFYRINRKTGRIETNLLEWERSWRNVKILKYPTRFTNELRLGVRDNHGLDQILQANVILPELDATREY